jgi:hypothetical protein
MAQYIAFRQGIEVSGQSMLSVLDAMGAYADVARKLLAQHGVRKVLPDAWYPQQPYLNAYRAVATEVGERTLLAIGKKVPEHALWPPEIQTIEDALRSVDVAYHMNHRLLGQPMFDPATGSMLEGIGHYKVDHVGKRRLVMTCETPYPSEFDRGIILGAGRKFEPSVEVELDQSQPTRLRGADHCTYVVTW